MADRLFEGEEAVLHVMGWVGGRARAPISVTARLFAGRVAVKRLMGSLGGAPGGSQPGRAGGLDKPAMAFRRCHFT